MSGGHCLLALCSSLHEFTLLGETVDDSPGEASDKCARMLGLHHLPGLRDVSGGRAIEIVARYSASLSWCLAFSLSCIGKVKTLASSECQCVNTGIAGDTSAWTTH